jgi:hypothetical protein
MIPLIIAALAIGALAAYELSPKVHAWVDDHIRALQLLFASVRASRAHIEAARSAPDPDTAAEQTRLAQASKAEAEKQAVIAKETAKTDAQKEAASRGAAAVDSLTAAIAGLNNLVSSAQSWFDTHTRAMVGANANHAAADAHLAAGSVAPDQDTAAAHTIAADAHNRVAAGETAVAAQNAKTPHEQTSVVKSAAKVEDRSKTIASVFDALGGAGLCGVRKYTRVTARVKDALLKKLHDAGMQVTGEDPWDIDTPLGVKLRAAWDSRAQELRVIVTEAADKSLCDQIWGLIDPQIKEIIAS